MKKDIETLIAEERAEIITKYDKVCAWEDLLNQGHKMLSVVSGHDSADDCLTKKLRVCVCKIHTFIARGLQAHTHIDSLH